MLATHQAEAEAVGDDAIDDPDEDDPSIGEGATTGRMSVEAGRDEARTATATVLEHIAVLRSLVERLGPHALVEGARLRPRPARDMVQHPRRVLYIALSAGRLEGVGVDIILGAFAPLACKLV